MKKIKIKNTYDVNISGSPSDTVRVLSDQAFYGVSPSRLDYIKPKLLVKEGDVIECGTTLFFDKKNDKNIYVSPVSGTVKEIVYGERRVVDFIKIESDKAEKKKQIFEPLSLESIESLKSHEVTDRIQQGGLWSTLIAFPFERVPAADQLPPSIYINLDNDEPHLPQSHMVLDANKEAYLFGLAVLKQLCDKVYVGIAEKSQLKDPEVRQTVTHQLVGGYPANNPGVFLYHNKTSESENSSWGIRAQGVIKIGQLFQTGQYPNQRLITLAGHVLDKPCYVQVTEGTPIKNIATEITNPSQLRVICGGLLTGIKASFDDFLSYNDDAIHIIPEGKEQELLHFFKPGFEKPTYSNAYLSTLRKDKEWDMTSALNGGYRACISCGYCAKVCPNEAYPHMIMKNLYVNDIETSMKQGILDCVDCGICTYVCPSKIELSEIVKKGKDMIHKEINS